MDKTFTVQGIIKEAQRVRWPQIRGTHGIVKNTGKVLVFAGVFAVVLAIGDFLASLLMRV